MKELLLYIARNLVDDPEAVSVTEVPGEQELTLELRVAPDDMGKVIGKQGAGLDNIDMDHAHAKDITVVYAPAGNANAVAEHAVMLMLMCAKRFTYVDRQFRSGNFLVRMGMEHTYELGGKTLGMIGCGRISQLAMQKCKYGFGMNVIGYDPYLTQDKIGDLCELKATAKEV